MAERVTATERLRKGIDEFFGSSGVGLEEVVNAKAFGDVLAQLTGNLVAISRIGGETLDLLIRNARLAGRRDVSELGRQLERIEDKLEEVLALVEELQSELKAERAKNAENAKNAETAHEASVETGPAARKSTVRKPAANQE